MTYFKSENSHHHVRQRQSNDNVPIRVYIFEQNLVIKIGNYSSRLKQGNNIC